MMVSEREKFGYTYRLTRTVVRAILPAYRIQQEETFDGPVVFVSHHQNMLGPVTVLANYPGFLRTWGLGVFFDQKKCFNHYMSYTLTQRFQMPSFFAKVFGWPFSFFVARLVQSGKMIPVHRNSRGIIQTMKESTQALEKGDSILIFPDVDYRDDSEEMGELYQGFLSLEKYYYRRTKKHVVFVPLYADEKSKEIRIGKAIRFSTGQSFIEERKKTARLIKQALNRLAMGGKQSENHSPSFTPAPAYEEPVQLERKDR